MILDCSIYTTQKKSLFSRIWAGEMTKSEVNFTFLSLKSLLNYIISFFMCDVFLANLCSLCNTIMLKICFINAF